jgi:hypothetical protein
MASVWHEHVGIESVDLRSWDHRDSMAILLSCATQSHPTNERSRTVIALSPYNSANSAPSSKDYW